MITTALLQFHAVPDAAVNRDRVSALVRAAAGADLMVLPEAALCGFGTDLAAAAEDLDGPFARTIEALASETGAVIVAGTFTPAPGGRVRNTLLVRGRGVTGEYRKIHLYDAYGSRESDAVAPGDRLVTFGLEDLTIGLATCYDVRFPEQFTALAAHGADAVVLPACWGDGPGKRDAWRLLTRARALDATSWLLACDQSRPIAPSDPPTEPDPSTEPDTPRTPAPQPAGIGLSAVIGPDGGVAAGAADGEAIVRARIDAATVARARAALPVLERRPTLPDTVRAL